MLYRSLISDSQRTILAKLEKPNANAINYTTVGSSSKESARNFFIQGYSNSGILRGNVKIDVDLPKDDKNSRKIRQYDQKIQSVQPWNNTFMHTPTDKARLNNPSQYSFVRQKQLGIPNTYQEFYAFMKALSTSFGSLHA